MYSPLEGHPSKVPNPHRRRRVCLLVLSACALLLLLVSGSRRAPSFALLAGSATETIPKRRHIAVASDFGSHFDVHLAAAHSTRQVLGDRGSVKVFARTPLRFGFQEVVDSLDLYDQEIQSPDEFMDALNSTTLYPDELGKMIDLVVFGTCEIDMRRWSDELLAAWDARPADQKFKLVCIVHNFRDVGWQRHIGAWASRGALRLLPIGYHVGRAFRAHFLELADSPDPSVYSAMYEYIDIDVHAPVLDLPQYGQKRTPTTLSRAVIQGSFQSVRRDYQNIFRDLLDALKNDPAVWGYRPLGYDRAVYEPMLNPIDEPFELHLIGDGHLEIPKELSKVVFVHNGLDYIEFYTLMQSMDVVLPAFVNQDYYDNQASSTIAMAVECNVPILATRRIRSAYGYIEDDRVTLVRPQSLREIQAIGALRGATRYVSSPDVPGTIAHARELARYEKDVQKMLRNGWRRPSNGYVRFKSELWKRNREAIRRVLNDLPGEIQ